MVMEEPLAWIRVGQDKRTLCGAVSNLLALYLGNRRVGASRSTHDIKISLGTTALFEGYSLRLFGVNCRAL